MVSKRFYVKAGEAILPLGLLRHGLIATRAAPPCPLGQLVGFSPPRFSGPSRSTRLNTLAPKEYANLNSF